MLLSWFCHMACRPVILSLITLHDSTRRLNNWQFGKQKRWVSFFYGNYLLNCHTWAMKSIQYYSIITGVSKKTIHSWKLKTLGTSYSETTKLLDLKLWQQGVLMSTPCCQISTVYRLLVSEYEVPKVLSFQEWIVFFETPCRSNTFINLFWVPASQCSHHQTPVTTIHPEKNSLDLHAA